MVAKFERFCRPSRQEALCGFVRIAFKKGQRTAAAHVPLSAFRSTSASSGRRSGDVETTQSSAVEGPPGIASRSALRGEAGRTGRQALFASIGFYGHLPAHVIHALVVIQRALTKPENHGSLAEACLDDDSHLRAGLCRLPASGVLAYLWVRGKI